MTFIQVAAFQRDFVRLSITFHAGRTLFRGRRRREIECPVLVATASDIQITTMPAGHTLLPSSSLSVSCSIFTAFLHSLCSLLTSPSGMQPQLRPPQKGHSVLGRNTQSRHHFTSAQSAYVLLQHKYEVQGNLSLKLILVK